MNGWDDDDIPPLVSPSGAFGGGMHQAGSFPRRAGTPFPGRAGQFGTAGGGQFQGGNDSWGHEGGFLGEYSGGTTFDPNGYPYENQYQPMAPGPGAYAYPSTSFAPQNGYDNSHYAALRQQPMSAPPDAAYLPPSWAANTGIAQHVQQPSPWDSMALTRPGSSMSMARPNSNMSYMGNSFNSYSPVSTLGRSPKTYGYDGGLPDRPSEWRKDFSMRSGLSSLLPRQRSSSYGDHNAHPRSQLHRFIRYTYNDPPVMYDLRLNPLTLSFRDVPRNILSSDLTRFACEPPVPYMRLYHPRLPWYIDVHASNPTGVNMGDLFMSIWTNLRWQIQKSDFWNEDVSDADRAKVGDAWRARCNGDIMEQKAGVRRVDFLRRHVVFEGLVKGRNGMWEMKTKKVA